MSHPCVENYQIRRNCLSQMLYLFIAYNRIFISNVYFVYRLYLFIAYNRIFISNVFCISIIPSFILLQGTIEK